ncbi:MAG: hypothetical protein KDC54_14975 [Lewinella sp.]|nr:hypothetical protein [Lewinella sp.]
MPNFWRRILGLAEQVEQSSPHTPVIHELIQRSEEEQADFAQWKNSFVLRRLLDWLSDQYAVFRVAPGDIDEALDFLQTPSSNGFVIHFFKTNYSRREVTHFFDYLKERVKTLPYRTQLSDTRTYNRPNWVETIEKHYLKPRSDREEGEKIDQQFGNITIELELRNDEVLNLRFRATHYQDHLFEPPRPFVELMQVLLEREA